MSKITVDGQRVYVDGSFHIGDIVLAEAIAEQLTTIKKLEQDNAKAFWIAPNGEHTSLPPSTWKHGMFKLKATTESKGDRS